MWIFFSDTERASEFVVLELRFYDHSHRHGRMLGACCEKLVIPYTFSLIPLSSPLDHGLRSGLRPSGLLWSGWIDETPRPPRNDGCHRAISVRAIGER